MPNDPRLIIDIWGAHATADGVPAIVGLVVIAALVFIRAGWPAIFVPNSLRSKLGHPWLRKPFYKRSRIPKKSDDTCVSLVKSNVEKSNS
jgi:hypothetical protein